jgi:hypothetical protein
VVALLLLVVQGERPFDALALEQVRVAVLEDGAGRERV